MKVTTEGPAGPRFKKLRVMIEFDEREMASLPGEVVARVVKPRGGSVVLQLCALAAALGYLLDREAGRPAPPEADPAGRY